MSEPLRVLNVLATLDRGGTESFVMNIYRHLDLDKVQFDFVKHTDKSGDFEDEILSMGGRVFTAPRYLVYNRIPYERWWHKHFQLHQEHKVVHGHFFTLSSLYFDVAHKYGSKTIGHSHAAGMVIRNPKDLLVRRYCKRVGRHSDYRFACGQDAGKWLYGDASFEVIHNSIDVEQFQYNRELRRRLRSRYGLDEKLVIGNVGNFTIPKNHTFMVDIMRSIKDMTSGAVLLSEDVLFLGRRDDVSDLMQAMDVFLMPSLSEGLPVAMIEAQASGLPVVCSDAVTREAMVTNRVAFVPLDAPIELWRESILDYQNDVASREEGAVQVAAAGYEITETARKLQDFYIRICS